MKNDIGFFHLVSIVPLAFKMRYQSSKGSILIMSIASIVPLAFKIINYSREFNSLNLLSIVIKRSIRENILTQDNHIFFKRSLVSLSWVIVINGINQRIEPKDNSSE